MLALVIARLPSCLPVSAILVAGIPTEAFWPWLLGFVTLAIGVARMAWRRPAGAEQWMIRAGLLLYAIPMAVYGGDHFVEAKFVASIVPPWIPWHLFWAYFVGVALVVAAMAIAADRLTTLAATMLGAMILSFALLLHLPGLILHPQQGVRLTLFLRDSMIGWCGIAYGAAWWGRRDGLLVTVARFVVAAAVAVFAFDHFLYPAHPPGIPIDNPAVHTTLPSWIPAHELWAYAAGVVLLAASIGLMMRATSRLGAMTVGAVMLFCTVFVYLPVTIANPLNIELGLNYLAIHMLWAGAALMLAASAPEPIPVTATRAASAEAVVPDLSRS